MAREALRDAARAGWSFRKGSDHSFGRLACCAVGQPGACKTVVYSTSGPADGSATAREIRRALRSCPHQLDQEGPGLELPTMTNDEELEARIERLTEAADGLSRRADAGEAAERAIERDDEEDFDEQERRFTDADNDALVAATGLGLPIEPWPPLVSRAELLGEATALMEAVSDPQARQRLSSLIQRASQ